MSLIGSKEGLANFIRLLINPTCEREEKDIVMIPDPGYASYKEFLKVSGGLAYPIPLTAENNYMPDFEEILAKMDAAAGGSHTFTETDNKGNIVVDPQKIAQQFQRSQQDVEIHPIHTPAGQTLWRNRFWI